ncbi:hypothetical protein ACTMU2_21450 [Cupriavidus basilensis]
MSLLHGRSTLTGNGLVPAYHASGNATEPDIYQMNRRAVLHLSRPDPQPSHAGRCQWPPLVRRHRDQPPPPWLYVRTSRRDTTNGDVNPDYEAYIEACEGMASTPTAPRAAMAAARPGPKGAALHPAIINTTYMRQQTVGAALSVAKETEHHVLNAGTTLDRSRLNYSQYGQPGTFTEDRGAVADPTAPNALVTGVSGNARTFGVHSVRHVVGDAQHLLDGIGTMEPCCSEQYRRAEQRRQRAASATALPTATSTPRWGWCRSWAAASRCSAATRRTTACLRFSNSAVPTRAAVPPAGRAAGRSLPQAGGLARL